MTSLDGIRDDMSDWESRLNEEVVIRLTRCDVHNLLTILGEWDFPDGSNRYSDLIGTLELSLTCDPSAGPAYDVNPTSSRPSRETTTAWNRSDHQGAGTDLGSRKREDSPT